MSRDPVATRYLDDGIRPTPDGVWERMAAVMGQWVLRGYGVMAVEDQDGFVGRVGFHHPYDVPHPLLIYAFEREVWGRGYACESAQAVLDWLKQAVAPDRVVAIIHHANRASIRVAEKLGAVNEGPARQRGHADIWALPIAV